MTTTLEKYESEARDNYCTLPTEDVEILPETRHCKDCGAVVAWQKDGYWGRWVHADEAAADHGYVSARSWCIYCNEDDPALVQFSFQSYSDETSCKRCGGVNGRAIGD